jgi:hypothetical protein
MKFTERIKYDLSYRMIQRELQRKAKKTQVEIGSVIFQMSPFRFGFQFLSLTQFFSVVRKLRKLFLNPLRLTYNFFSSF